MGKGERPVADDATGLAGPRFNITTRHGVKLRRTSGGFADGIFQLPGAANQSAEMPLDIAFLAQAGMSRQVLARATKIADEKAIAASEVLFARGYLTRAAYLQALAEKIGARFEPALPQDAALSAIDRQAVGDVLQASPVMARRGTSSQLFLAAGPQMAKRLIGLAGAQKNLAGKLVLTTHAALRLGHLSMLRQSHARRAAQYLARAMPGFSACYRLSSGQILAFAGMLVSALFSLVYAPGAFMLATTAALTVFYLASVLLRALLIWRLDLLPLPARYVPDRFDPEDLPNYTILVALYRESGQVGELVRALSALDWPTDRREVFLVCEEVDPATINAIRAIELPQGFHLVICPDSKPRTKPKALNFALPLASGDYIVIYDAEDLPHPLQLRQAHELFGKSDGKLACLQAPLVVVNRHENWLTAMFALEYQTLFSGILPVLTAMGGPIPLGGTSNHFRTDVLRQVAGWDAWNVTEDADLGVRLARLGYRCGVLSLPTFEEAPAKLAVWLGQRTRWLKGWMQTILVHTRNPALLHRQLGWKASTMFHLMLTSIVISTLVHPIFLAIMAVQLWQLAGGQAQSLNEALITGLSIFNLVAGYTTYGFFAHEIGRRNGQKDMLPFLAGLPAYWLLISLAGWRAMWHLLRQPFHWEKTEHGLAKSPFDANMP